MAYIDTYTCNHTPCTLTKNLATATFRVVENDETL